VQTLPPEPQLPPDGKTQVSDDGLGQLLAQMPFTQLVPGGQQMPLHSTVLQTQVPPWQNWFGPQQTPLQGAMPSQVQVQVLASRIEPAGHALTHWPLQMVWPDAHVGWQVQLALLAENPGPQAGAHCVPFLQVPALQHTHPWGVAITGPTHCIQRVTQVAGLLGFEQKVHDEVPGPQG
jgi:hypothetical protein